MNIGICGISGRMGMAVLDIMLERGHFLTAAFDSDSSHLFEKNVSTVNDACDVQVTSIRSDECKKTGGIIDFSSPNVTKALVDSAVESNTPLVIGTTGHSEEEKQLITEGAGKIPILFSPNMSVGVNIFFKLTELAAKALGEGYDAEIVEAHHRFKKDAPSGTANRIMEIIKEAKAGLAHGREVTGRSGIVGERRDDEIGIMALRGGDIVGEHSVYFIGMGERIELSHRATDRNILARGAVLAMEFLHDKDPGLYSMYDALGI